MRVLIATEHASVVGGVETYLRTLLPALVDSGHELVLFTLHPDTPGTPSIRDGYRSITHQCSSTSSLASCLEMLERWKPDVCYLHGLTDPAIEEALLDRFRVLFFFHNYQGTCISGTKRFGWPRPRPCSRRFGAACLSLYLPRRCGGTNPRTMWRLFRKQLRHNRLLRRYPRIAAGSRRMGEELERHGVDPKRISLLKLFPPDQAPDASPPAPRPFTDRLLVLGRLTELKGTHLLLRALPKIQDRLGRQLELVIAGDGADRPRLERMAAKGNLSVRFTGWIDSSARIELMRNSDLLVLPGTWPEPFGLVGIEAGCVGLPSVAFDLGGIPDWCRSGVSGILASGSIPRVANLVDAVVEAMSDPVQHQSLREGAWRIAKEYDLGNHLRQLEVEFEQLQRSAADLSPQISGSSLLP